MGMAQTLASDMVRKSLDIFLESAQRPHDLSPDEMRELLASCEIPALVLEGLWQLTQRFLDRGTEGTHLAFLLKECVDVFDLGIKAFDTARARVKAADLTPEERTAGVSLLTQAGQRAVARRDELSALLQRLETPPRDVMASSLPGDRGKREAGGYVGLDDLTARLLSREK